MATTKLTCPSCAAVLQLAKAVSSSARLKCPRCAAVFSPPAEVPIEVTPITVSSLPVAVPDDDPVPVVRPQEPVASYEESDDAEVRRPRRRKFRKKRQSQGVPLALALVMIFGAIAIMGLAIVVAIFLWPAGEQSVAGGGPLQGLRDSLRPANKSKDWKPDPTLLNQLGPPQVIGGHYEFRPPRGYVLQKGRRDGGEDRAEFHEFKGPVRPDATFSRFGVAIGPRPPAESPEQLLGQLLTYAHTGDRGEFATWDHTPMESGQINGLAFARTIITANAPTGQQMRGFLYVALDEDRMIVVIGQDLVPNYEHALNLTEAAALTFKKRS